MALRLTNTTAAGATAPVASAAPDQALLDRARTVLAVGDLDAFRSLASEVEQLTDPHRRYVVARTIVDLGIAETRRPGSDSTAVTLASAQVALDVLTPAPAEPVLLNLAGILLFGLGSLAGAEALCTAAESLDPTTPSVVENLAALRRLRKAGQRPATHPSVVGVLPGLERRAKALAAQARPADSATISLCMIAKDEERAIGRALASAQGVVDEIIVVDTGSSDRTIEIAREHGARIVERPWDDDFAAARNAGLELATSDWVLVLDADEQIIPEDAARLRLLARRTWREGFLLTVVNRRVDGSAMSVDLLRMVRNRPQHRFEGRIHEGILHCLPADAPERTEPAGVRLAHDGYLPEVRAAKDKSRRNLALLERQVAENPPSAYIHFNLGAEYHALADLDEAATHFDKAWELLRAEPRPDASPFAAPLHFRRASVHRSAGRAAEAIEAAQEGLSRFPDHTDIVFEQALAHRDRGEAAEAEALLRRCLELGDAPSRYAAASGAGTYLPATALGRLLVLRGAAAEAAELLETTLAQHPFHDDARLVLADALIALGRYAEAADVAGAVAEDAPLATMAAARRHVATAAAGGHDGPLPGSALTSLTLALNARLAAADIDGFVALLPLTERLEGVGGRERREMLASLYLAHGFLDSAADEWAAACEEHGPDAAAFTGLSRVAAARGDHEDARVFAEGARELAGAPIA